MTFAATLVGFARVWAWFAKTFARYRGHLGPSGPKWPKESETAFRDLSAPAVQKVKTESKKSQNSRKMVDFDSFSTPFGPFWAPRPDKSLELISNSFCHFGPEGPK